MSVRPYARWRRRLCQRDGPCPRRPCQRSRAPRSRWSAPRRTKTERRYPPTRIAWTPSGILLPDSRMRQRRHHPSTPARVRPALRSRWSRPSRPFRASPSPQPRPPSPLTIGVPGRVHRVADRPRLCGRLPDLRHVSGFLLTPLGPRPHEPDQPRPVRVRCRPDG